MKYEYGDAFIQHSMKIFSKSMKSINTPTTPTHPTTKYSILSRILDDEYLQKRKQSMLF